MLRARASKWLVAAALCAVALAAPLRARADGLSGDEGDRLARGDTVVRAQTIDDGERRYVGGVAYTVVDSSLAEVQALFEDVEAYRRVLPRTKSARRIGVDRGDTLVELRQGNALVTATYTVRVRRSADGRTVRFWMDPARPHAIDDAWGFLRAEPTEDGRTLLTWGVLLDMGDGLARELFEERVRALALTVPQLVRGYLAERAAARPRLAAASSGLD